MPFFRIFLVFLLLASFNICTVLSINPETGSATPNDWAVIADSAIPTDSGDLKAFLFAARTDQITQGLPNSQGISFANSNPATSGSLIASSDTNPVRLGSGFTASGGLGLLPANLDTVISGSDLSVPGRQKGGFISSNIALNAPETVAIVPEDQELLLDNSIVTSSTPETDVPISKDQGLLHLGSKIALSTSDTDLPVPEDDTALTISDVQSEVFSGTVPCDSKQTRDEGLSCPTIYNQLGKKPRPGRKKPQRNQPEDFIEPEQDTSEESDSVEYGLPNPWLTNSDDDRKRCSNTKYTLCCDGPSRLTQWVSDCFICRFLSLLFILTRPPPPKNQLELKLD